MTNKQHEIISGTTDNSHTDIGHKQIKDSFFSRLKDLVRKGSSSVGLRIALGAGLAFSGVAFAQGRTVLVPVQQDGGQAAVDIVTDDINTHRPLIVPPITTWQPGGTITGIVADNSGVGYVSVNECLSSRRPSEFGRSWRSFHP